MMAGLSLLVLVTTGCTTSVLPTYRQRVHVLELTAGGTEAGASDARADFNDAYRTCAARRASVIDYSTRATRRRDGFTIAIIILTAIGSATAAALVPISSILINSTDESDRDYGVALNVVNGSVSGLLSAIVTALSAANAIDSGGLADAGPALAAIDNSLARAWQAANSAAMASPANIPGIQQAGGSLRDPNACNPRIGGRAIPDPIDTDSGERVERPEGPPTLPAL